MSNHLGIFTRGPMMRYGTRHPCQPKNCYHVWLRVWSLRVRLRRRRIRCFKRCSIAPKQPLSEVPTPNAGACCVAWCTFALRITTSVFFVSRAVMMLPSSTTFFLRNTVLASGTLGAGQTETLTYTNSTTKAVTINIKVFGVNGAFSSSSPYYLKGTTL